MPTPLGDASLYDKSSKDRTGPSEFLALRDACRTVLLHSLIGSLLCALCSGGDRRPL